MSWNWIYLLRLLIASILGILIGFERKLRYKEAGMRTHSLVSLGSCLMMMISLYAIESGADKARIGAQIVSGVGFLGAGMIMFKKDGGGVHGLTTAAGVWVTSGVGMAIGSGMYLLGIGACVLTVAIELIFHLPLNFFHRKKTYQLKISYYKDGEINNKLKEIFKFYVIAKFYCVKENDKLKCFCIVNTDSYFDNDKIGDILENNSSIQSIERIEDF